MTTNRRFPPEHADSIAGQPWNNARGTVARLLKWCVDYASSIPGGFFGTDPEAIEPDDAASPGNESAGWAAADHVHPIVTATAAALANVAAEGSATSFSRSDHQHKRDVRVAKAGSDVGTRNRLNFIEGTNVSLTVVDDAGNDEVDITVTSSSAPVVAVTTKAIDYTATSSDCVILVDASGAARTITLPTAASSTGRIYHIKKIDSSANAVIIDGNGAELIDGSATVTMTTQYQSRSIVSDASAWHVF